MIINRSGITLRLRVTDIRRCGRATQGVKLINLTKRNDAISSVCLVPTDADEENIKAEEELQTSEPQQETENALESTTLHSATEPADTALEPSDI